MVRLYYRYFTWFLLGVKDHVKVRPVLIKVSLVLSLKVRRGSSAITFGAVCGASAPLSVAATGTGHGFA